MKQNSRWSEAQLKIIKEVLAENDTAITAIRKVFLEDKLTDLEEKALETAIRKKPAVQEVLRRHYAPELVVDAPIGQVQDRMMFVNVSDLDPLTATLHAAGMEKAIKCMDQHLEELFTGKTAGSYKNLYKFDLNDPEKTYVGLYARNRYVRDVESLTHHLSLLAGQKNETPEQTMERLRKDSAR